MTSHWRRAAVAAAAAMLALTATACFNNDPIRPQDAGDGDLFGAVATDKSRYNPGDSVRYKVKMNAGDGKGTLVVRYKQLNRTVDETEIEWNGAPEIEWEWLPPAEDYTGYMTEMFIKQGDDIADHTNIAVDVSSDWGKFPRYGYLADFMAMERSEREAVIERLNRFHINGIQFYDWQWKHHIPLKTESGKPTASWPDIAKREVSFETVKSYIDLAHDKNMKAMNYNLLFGAYEDAEQDGVKKEWGLFSDPLHKNQDRHPLPDSWASDIFLMDPSNPEWQNYLFEKEKETFRHLPFDGWHVDQLGDRGARWNYDGKSVNLAAAYAPFLKAAKSAIDVDYVMNAVGQYGQAFIASQAPAKFLYTEVWNGHPQYKNLKQIVDQNLRYSKGKLNTVFAAYMNYNHSNSQGEFNAPGVLLTDAVIFASGGSHLELGENMLSKEYFPHKNLTITPELERQLIRYYDFLTAYQNILRDEVQEAELEVKAVSGAEKGKVWMFAKQKENMDIMHLINFTDAGHMLWNDTDATQTEPQIKQNVKLSLKTDRIAGNVWMASPDFYGGSATDLNFTQKNGILDITVPHLHYWDVIVIDYEDN
ncbi:glycoside hydrolase family 66 protein [Paenibacillus alkalitolerans]|uniref:glycoside hydrolase family 66 protein n=1 Tax=Paenibacillus alkalitolerans TaxID=2799335 RepID=UPI0018F6EE2F|nr:glycoside hydrolase family 66 protein [Paenibacillus alkalitolerans]